MIITLPHHQKEIGALYINPLTVACLEPNANGVTITFVDGTHTHSSSTGEDADTLFDLAGAALHRFPLSGGGDIWVNPKAITYVNRHTTGTDCTVHLLPGKRFFTTTTIDGVLKIM